MENTKKNYWVIDGDNNKFDTLREAKYHIWMAYTAKERRQLDRSVITHITNEKAISYVFVYVDENGKESYSRIKKF